MFYSISELERYSGIKAHTIRIWEQRYQILDPHRTETNIRYYDDDQLRHLLNVATLVRNGERISMISKMSKKELAEAITKVEQKERPPAYRYEQSQNAILTAALALDEERFEKVFAHCMLHFGLEDTYVNIIVPVLTRTGLLWRKDQLHPGQEHFFSCLIRQKLFTAIDGVPFSPDNDEHWLLMLPEKEEHDIGLLFSNLMLRKYSRPVTYLGQRVPLSSAIAVKKQIEPTHILIFISGTMNVEEVQGVIDEYASAFSDVPVFVGGGKYLLENIEFPDNIKPLATIEALMNILEPSITSNDK